MTAETYVNKLKQHRFLGKDVMGGIVLIRTMGCYYHFSALCIEFQITGLGYNGRLESKVISADIPDNGQGSLKDIHHIKTVIRSCLKDFKVKGISRLEYRLKLGYLGDAF